MMPLNELFGKSPVFLTSVSSLYFRDSTQVVSCDRVVIMFLITANAHRESGSGAISW
jgi:hypothetical protein